MSISIVLIPLALALSLTVDSVIQMQLEQKNKEQLGDRLAPMQSIFTDAALLEKTLREHGFAVTLVSENEVVCQVGTIRLDYTRQTAGEPFLVTVTGINNLESFLAEMECFEREYRQNVQSYTYQKLMENLAASHMRVAQETVLEDNSILLTIDI
ncbi:MAG: hypothetical protein LBI54_03275 [Lachnospiraceae bacterium]|jgi:hypothetical protein|nr:hypothetical protein [Lachnospiraceae bacterium]